MARKRTAEPPDASSKRASKPPASDGSSPLAGRAGDLPGTSEPEAQAMDVDSPASAENVPSPAAPAAPDQGSRRDQMAEIARRRAAHFAHFEVEDDADEADAHVGGTEARNLGPWSSAMQLVEARAEAAAARADKRKNQALAAAQSAASQVSWSPSRDARQGQALPLRVLPLTSMTLQLLVDHIEDVESLWGLPDILKVKLAAVVCERRKLTPEVARIFTEAGPGEVALPDCTQLEEPHMTSLLQDCATPRLERLELGMCGRGFGHAAAAAVTGSSSAVDPSSGRAAKPSMPALRLLSLGGAYRATDDDVTGVLQNAPCLQELCLRDCSRLQGGLLQGLQTLAPELRVLDLSNCRGLGAQNLRAALASTSAGFPLLHTLNLEGITEMSDMLLVDISLALPALTRLDISRCGALTDASLRGISGSLPGLKALYANDVGKLTDGGLMAIAESCLGLEELSLRRCQKITDAPLIVQAEKRCLRKLILNNVVGLTDALLIALATHCKDTLEELDASWCRNLTSSAFGLLSDSCLQLRKLQLFGCSQVESSMLLGHSNADLRITGAPAQKVVQPDFGRAELLVAAEA